MKRVVLLFYGILVMGSGTGVAMAEETRFEPRFTVAFPYLVEPTSGTGDTSLGIGVDTNLFPGFLASQELSIGVLGRNAVRYSMGPTIRFFPSRSFSPEISAVGLIQFRPDSNGGFAGRVGVTWEASRAWDIWFLRFTAETGLSLLFRKPRTLEYDIIRLSLSVPF